MHLLHDGGFSTELYSPDELICLMYGCLDHIIKWKRTLNHKYWKEIKRKKKGKARGGQAEAVHTQWKRA